MLWENGHSTLFWVLWLSDIQEEKEMNKKTIIALIVFVAVLALVVGIYFATRPKTEPKTDTTEGTAVGTTFTLIVVHGDNSEKTFTITSEKPYLSGALIDEGIITDEGLETGMYFTVDGETSSWEENQSYWAFYIGDAYANYGMNDAPIEEGAVYKLVYTIG